MIGMILLVNRTKRRTSAHFLARRRFFIETATKEGILIIAGVSAYPRNAPAYTIRTPSLDGQTDLAEFRLPVFFHCGDQSLAKGCSGTDIFDNDLASVTTYKKGDRTCISRKSLWRWQPVQALLPAVTRLVSRRLAGLRLARALPLFSMKTSAKAETCSTASSTRISAADRKLHVPQPFQAARTCSARLFTSLKAFFQFPDLPKKDTQCSTRS